jgi:hypothetical protein
MQTVIWHTHNAVYYDIIFINYDESFVTRKRTLSSLFLTIFGFDAD